MTRPKSLLGPSRLLLALPLAVLAGCGYGNADRVPVRGSVTLNGAPVDGGVILFVPKGLALLVTLMLPLQFFWLQRGRMLPKAAAPLGSQLR